MPETKVCEQIILICNALPFFFKKIPFFLQSLFHYFLSSHFQTVNVQQLWMQLCKEFAKLEKNVETKVVVRRVIVLLGLVFVVSTSK
jgi:hypothetical protein